MIEVVELFNTINNLHSRFQTEAQPRQPRQLTRTPRTDSIHWLDTKSLILNATSINSTNSAHSILSGPRFTTQRCAAERLFNRGQQDMPKSEGFIGRYGV